ncbi:hypothetical protein HZD82_26815, partial [Pantoea agglomerans]|nr:hypothetical protein [Pantoea agglomerans]
GIPGDKLVTMAKLFVVISEWISDNDIDTTAIQCWTSLQENWKSWTSQPVKRLSLTRF